MKNQILIDINFSFSLHQTQEMVREINAVTSEKHAFYRMMKNLDDEEPHIQPSGATFLCLLFQHIARTFLCLLMYVTRSHKISLKGKVQDF